MRLKTAAGSRAIAGNGMGIAVIMRLLASISARHAPTSKLL